MNTVVWKRRESVMCDIFILTPAGIRGAMITSAFHMVVLTTGVFVVVTVIGAEEVAVVVLEGVPYGAAGGLVFPDA